MAREADSFERTGPAGHEMGTVCELCGGPAHGLIGAVPMCEGCVDECDQAMEERGEKKSRWWMDLALIGFGIVIGVLLLLCVR